MDKLIEQAIKNCKINKYEKYFEQVCKEYKRLLDEESKQLNLPPVSNLCSPAVAKQIIAVRDAIVANDYEEAYHQLYLIGSPNCDKYADDVWKDIEKIAGERYVSQVWLVA